MSKLFLFCIGGTGARVIKSLAFLLASGIRTEINEIIPIIIDPDRSNGDLNRTIEILKIYKDIHSQIEFNHNKFFHTKITPLNELDDHEKDNADIYNESLFQFELESVQNQLFSEFIDFNNLDESNKALTSSLFSNENLGSRMDEGFKGNPNIGSVVLNQIKDSKAFKYFASNFSVNDRIFIVSSIFGGTGAAGFPLLLKNIRNASDNIPNHKLLQDSIIGAISILPYFGVTSNANSKINKATFISKTRAALAYYSRNITGNNSLNAMYYIGDDYSKDYENHEGSVLQKNDAHFIEFAAALSIIDFMGINDNSMVNINGKAKKPVYKEFGVKIKNEVMDFTHLGSKTKIAVIKPMTQLMLFNLYIKNQLDKSMSYQPWARRGNIKIDKNFKSQVFYSDYILKFFVHFNDWLIELSRNKRAFEPFNLKVSKNIFNILNNIDEKQGFQYKKNFSLFDDRLNKYERILGDRQIEEKFMGMFYKATEAIASDKYHF